MPPPVSGSWKSSPRSVRLSPRTTSCWKELSKRVNLPVHEVSRLIAILEQNQFLMRRGRLVRVNPDVLADHLLYRAAVDENGTPTGLSTQWSPRFVRRWKTSWPTRRNLTGGLPQRHITNPVLEEIWHDMLRLLPTLSNRQRAELVGQLKRAGGFAPAEVLSICEWIIDHPDAPKDELLAQWGLQDTSEKLTDTLADVVAFIATLQDFTKRCAAQLWKLATLDERPEGPHPDHPRRRLGELVQYKATSDLKMLDGVQAGAIEFLIPAIAGRISDRECDVGSVDLGRGSRAYRRSQRMESPCLDVTGSSLSHQLSLSWLKRRNGSIESLAVVARGKKLDEAATALRELSTLLQPSRGPFGHGLDATDYIRLAA